MENNSLFDENAGVGLYITNQARLFLREISKWTKFLSILGFVGVALMVIMSFFIGAIMSNLSQATGQANMSFPAFFFPVIYLIIAAIYLIPLYYLYKFSSDLRNALDSNNPRVLEDSFGFLKSHYKFIGIATIVVMALYALTIGFGFFIAILAV